MRTTLLAALAAIALLAGCNKNNNSQVSAGASAGPEPTPLPVPGVTSEPKPRLSEVRATEPLPTPAGAPEAAPVAEPPRMSEVTRPDANGGLAPAAPAGAVAYKVQANDTLWRIAATKLGNGQRWKEIPSLNPGLEPSKMKIGQVIFVPEK
jgi:LysM repeat protein